MYPAGSFRKIQEVPAPGAAEAVILLQQGAVPPIIPAADGLTEAAAGSFRKIVTAGVQKTT